LRGFPVSGVGVIFGTAVKQTGQRDCGGCGIPNVVADSGVGAARWATA
jgi:hypothetical protein